MNSSLIHTWNSVVTDSDTVYFLGDFAFAGTQKIESILKQLNRYKLIHILGNHDRQTSTKRWLELGMDEVHEQLYLEEYNLLLCHFPYSTGAENEDQRYLNLRPIDKGISLIHGHVHSAPASKIRFTPLGSLCYDAGVDANSYKPIRLDEVLIDIESCTTNNSDRTFTRKSRT
jgi:calcineurin-like phosphoesterase family protein